MKPRTLIIANSFSRYALCSFAAALMIVGLQLLVDGICVCLQSERDD